MSRSVFVVLCLLGLVITPVESQFGQDVALRLACQKLEQSCRERLDGRTSISLAGDDKYGQSLAVVGGKKISLHWHTSGSGGRTHSTRVDVSSGQAVEENFGSSSSRQILFYGGGSFRLSLAEIEELTKMVVGKPRIEMPHFSVFSAEYAFDYDLKSRKPYQVFEDAAAHGRYLTRRLRFDLGREYPKRLLADLARSTIRHVTAYLSSVKPLLEHDSTEARDKAARDELQKIAADVQRELTALEKAIS